MLRRFLFFGFGVIISIFFLSMGPTNRLKETFYAYLDYFDMDKRVITHLVNDSTIFSQKSECQLQYFEISKEELLTVLDEGNVNFDLSDEQGEPCQYFVVENTINKMELSVKFELCYYQNKRVTVMDFFVDGKNEICNIK
tara:strand:+ start:126 stop:545 length:420 start_codon:yes stop_codon:yes gene_type:complete